MAYPSVCKTLLGFSAAILASGFLLFANSAKAAPPVISVIAGNGQTVFAREGAVLSATVSDDSTAPQDLTYIWSFGDTESDFGDSANAVERGKVTHYYDKGRTYNGQLRVIDAAGESSQADFSVVVNGVRTPVTLNRDRWPFAHITRPGNGPYAVGQATRFSADLSEIGVASAALDTPAYEWRLYNDQRAPIGDMVSGSAFNYTFPTSGFYRLELRINQIEIINGLAQHSYDTDTFVFEATSNPARVASQTFSVSIEANPTKIDDLKDPQTMTQIGTFKAVVTGGTGNFIYNWAYAPENDGFVYYQIGPTSQRESSLSAPPPQTTSQIQFKSPGTKHILVTVQDEAWQKVNVIYDFVIINSAYPANRTFSPDPPTTVITQPLVLSLTQDDSMPLLNPATSLTGPVAPQTYKFRAAATGGTLGGPQGYTYNWSATANTRQGTCGQTCTYVFKNTGSYQVKVDITDSSSPPKTASQSLTVVIGAIIGSTPPPSGGTGGTTGGGTTGGTSGGSTGGSTGGTAGGTAGGTSGGSSGTIVDPSGTNYGLNTSFKDVTIGQSTDPKATAAKIINIILGFLGIIAVILGLWGGFQIMTAAGNEDKVASGRKTMTYAVIGLVIIFVAWGIAQFVITNLLSATS